jgi:soluble lytic murein transglycosylase-like protein
MRAAALVGLFLLSSAGAAWAGPTGKMDAELRAKLVAAIKASDSFEDKFSAEVWLTDMSGRLKPYVADQQERLTFLRTLHAEAKRARIAPELVLAVIHVESRFNRFAISSAGAQGYMQIMPFWLKEIGAKEDNLFNMRTNLRMGCTILRHYLDREKGRLVPALARYNGSYGKPDYSYLVLDALNKRWYRA